MSFVCAYILSNCCSCAQVFVVNQAKHFLTPFCGCGFVGYISLSISTTCKFKYLLSAWAIFFIMFTRTRCFILCVQAFIYCLHGKRDHTLQCTRAPWLAGNKRWHHSRYFGHPGVNGRALIELSENDLKELFPILGDRKAVQRVVDRLKPQQKVHQVSVTRAIVLALRC